MTPRFTRPAFGSSSARALTLGAALACGSAILHPLALPSAVLAQPAEPGQESNAGHQQFVFAYRLLQRGEDALAIDAFDKYLSSFPRDAKRGDALYYRALLSRRAGRNAEALKYLENLPTPKHVPDHAVLLLRGQLASDLGQHQQAIEALEKIDLSNLRPDVKASIHYLQGQSYRGLGNLPAAAVQLGEVVKLDSTLRPGALVDLARVQMELKQPAEALKTLKQCLALDDPRVAADAARLAGDLSYQQKQYEPAIEYYKLVLTKYTTSSHVSPSAVGLLWSQFELKQYGQVLASFEQYKTNLVGQDQVAGWYLAGSSQQELGKHEQAITLFTAILAAATGSPLEDKVLFRLASCQYEVGQYHGMTDAIARLRKAYPDSPRLADAGFLMASAALKQNDLTNAAARLTAIIDAGQAHAYYTQALLQRAKLYESSNQLQPAANDYQTYAAVYRDAQGQYKLPLTSVHEALLRLTDLNYRLEKYEAADQAAAQLLALDNLSPLVESEALYRRALALVKLKDYQRAHDVLTTLLDRHPQNPYRADALYYRGLLLTTLKKPDDANRDLLAAAGSDQLAQPLRINAWRLLGIRHREAKKSAEALAALTALEELVSLRGLTSDEKFWLGDYHLKQHDAKLALKYFQPLLEPAANSSRALRVETLLRTAKALRQLQDRDAAILALREVIATGQGQGFAARLELAQTLMEKQEYEEALGELDGLINVEDTPIAANALFDQSTCHLALAADRLRASDQAGVKLQREEARKALKRLVLLYSFKELSPLPELSFLGLAEIALEQGNAPAAKAEWNELLEKFPEGPFAVYAKAQLAKADNQVNVARGLLAQLQQQTNLDPRLAARVAEALKQLEGRS